MPLLKNCVNSKKKQSCDQSPRWDEWLKRLKLTVKKNLHPNEKETERAKAQGRVLGKNSLHSGRRPSLCWWSRGQFSWLDCMRVHYAVNELEGVVLKKRGKNVSMIGAIALKGIVASINLLGATDGLTWSVCHSKLASLWQGALCLG